MENPRDLEIRKKIDAYVKGQLSEDEIQTLWEDFAKNPQLLEILEIEVGVKKILSDKKKQAAPTHKLPGWAWHAAAAAVLLIVMLAQLFKVDTPTELEDFLVHHIGPEQLETAEVLRADEIYLTAADSLLNIGFEAVISGNSERAMEVFNTIIKQYDEEPYGSKAFLNKGIILYNESEYEQSVSAFRESAERAENSRMISEKAYWYLGNALINVGELEDARNAVYEAYKLEGVFRSAAHHLLQKLNYDLGKYDYDDFDSQLMD